MESHPISRQDKVEQGIKYLWRFQRSKSVSEKVPKPISVEDNRSISEVDLSPIKTMLSGIPNPVNDSHSIPYNPYTPIQKTISALQKQITLQNLELEYLRQLQLHSNSDSNSIPFSSDSISLSSSSIPSLSIHQNENDETGLSGLGRSGSSVSIQQVQLERIKQLEQENRSLKKSIGIYHEYGVYLRRISSGKNEVDENGGTDRYRNEKFDGAFILPEVDYGLRKVQDKGEDNLEIKLNEVSKMCAILRKENDIVKSQKKVLEDKLNSNESISQNFKRKITELENQVSGLTTENQRLAGNLKNLKQSEEMIVLLQNHVHRLEEYRSQTSLEIDSLKGKVKILETELLKEKDCTVELSNEIIRLRTSNETSQERINGNEVNKPKNDQFFDRNVFMETEFDQKMRSLNAELQQRDIIIHDQQNQIAKLNELILSLGRNHNSSMDKPSDADSETHSRLLKQVASISEERDRLLAFIGSKENESTSIKTERDRYQTLVTELEGKLCETEARHKEVLEKVDSLESMLSNWKNLSESFHQSSENHNDENGNNQFIEFLKLENLALLDSNWKLKSKLNASNEDHPQSNSESELKLENENLLRLLKTHLSFGDRDNCLKTEESSESKVDTSNLLGKRGRRPSLTSLATSTSTSPLPSPSIISLLTGENETLRASLVDLESQLNALSRNHQDVRYQMDYLTNTNNRLKQLLIESVKTDSEKNLIGEVQYWMMECEVLKRLVERLNVMEKEWSKVMIEREGFESSTRMLERVVLELNEELKSIKSGHPQTQGSGLFVNLEGKGHEVVGEETKHEDVAGDLVPRKQTETADTISPQLAHLDTLDFSVGCPHCRDNPIIEL